MSRIYPIIVVGGGPAGIGIASLLWQCVMPALVLERGRIGESFHRWPKETRFISPSFTGNFFGSVDLNAVTPNSSPAYGLQTEHPTGSDYVTYLEDVADAYSLDIKNGVDVQDFEVDDKNIYTLHTNEGAIRCRVLIWAGGELQYPNKIPNTVRVGSSYTDFPTGHHVIIGGAESGIEAAFNLVKKGSSVTVIDPAAPWADELVSDSSYGLSPYTFDRLRLLNKTGKVEFISEAVCEINEKYIRTKNREIHLEHPAIDATGFDIEQSLAGRLFNFTDGHPELTEFDESTKYRNVFLVGPNVQHDRAIFCFIYKYRQRFAVIAKEILRRWGNESPVIDEYASKGFLLDDLSCCDGECTC